MSVHPPSKVEWTLNNGGLKIAAGVTSVTRYISLWRKCVYVLSNNVRKCVDCGDMVQKVTYPLLPTLISCSIWYSQRRSASLLHLFLLTKESLTVELYSLITVMWVVLSSILCKVLCIFHVEFVETSLSSVIVVRCLVADGGGSLTATMWLGVVCCVGAVSVAML